MCHCFLVRRICLAENWKKRLVCWKGLFATVVRLNIQHRVAGTWLVGRQWTRRNSNSSSNMDKGKCEAEECLLLESWI